jgi:hypothetical protein
MISIQTYQKIKERLLSLEQHYWNFEGKANVKVSDVVEMRGIVYEFEKKPLEKGD